MVPTRLPHELSALITSFLLCYGGLALFAVSMQRHRGTVGLAKLNWFGDYVLKGGGVLLLALSLKASVQVGWVIGIVQWLGGATLAGLGLIFILSLWPRVAFGLVIAALSTLLLDG